MSFWPEDIVEAIARRKSVILIGSGVSANAKNSNGAAPPTWRSFLESANKNAPNGKKRYISDAIKGGQYLDACYYLKESYGAKWIRLLKESYAGAYTHADIHQAIFDLDSRIVASLNFDSIYEDFARRNSDNSCVLKNYYDKNIRQVVAGNERYILKVHGSIDTPDALIFTAEDYAKARVTYSNFYEILNALLHTHTFLLIGCGVTDPDMQWIFEDYNYKHSESPHYILLKKETPDKQLEMLRETRGLNTLKYSSKDGHRELTARLQELVVLVNEERNALTSSQNW